MRHRKPAPAPAVLPSPAVYSYAGLEDLWEQAGGSSGTAATAACIAEHESGGRADAISPTDDWGLWQVNRAYHGPVLATLNPLRNAKAAILLSGDGTSWAPWTTAPDCTSVTRPVTAAAVTVSARGSTAARALAWAETRTGIPYVWGGTGPDGYDCSGLVQAAYKHADGILLPRDTYGMLGSRLLVRTRDPRPGDLAFFGSGHVELVTALYDTTFGAQRPGTDIGWHLYSGNWEPTAFYEVV